MDLNKEILLYINNFGTNEIVKRFVYIFADAPIFFIPIFLIVFRLYYNHINKSYGKRKLINITWSIILGISISLLIQQCIILDRPETALINSGNLLLKHIPDASFPSDHATVSFAFLVSLFLGGFKKVGLIFLPFVILMNLSRIIAGVHWPFDVLAGSFVGIISSIIIFKTKVLNYTNKINNFIIKILGYIKL